MIRVRATNMSMKMGQKIKELHRIATPGEEFDVSESRYNFLSGNNPFHKVYVIKVPTVQKVEEVKTEVIKGSDPEPIIINPEVSEVKATEEAKPKKKKKKKEVEPNE